MNRFIFALLLFCFSPVPASAETYTVAHAAEWPPFEFLNKNNQVVGYSVDYIQAVAREAGFTVININIPWDGIFSRLERGEYRIIASSVTITEQRKKRMSFSLPYFTTGQCLLLPAKSAIASRADLKNVVLAAQSGTTGQSVINSYEATAKLFDDVGDAVEELAQGDIDGIVCDDHVARHFLSLAPLRGKIALAPFPVSDTQEEYGFVVMKDDTALLEEINAGIRAVRKKGIDKEIYTKWFGTSKPVH